MKFIAILKKEFKEMAIWLYLASTIVVVYAAYRYGGQEYLLTILFPLFWIIWYFVARLKLRKNQASSTTTPQTEREAKEANPQ